MIHYEIDRVLLENHSTPQKQNLSEVKDPKEKKIINRQHKVSLALYNQEKTKAQ
jgi:hypothetical protein